jgi:hypothetical protein
MALAGAFSGINNGGTIGSGVPFSNGVGSGQQPGMIVSSNAAFSGYAPNMVQTASNLFNLMPKSTPTMDQYVAQHGINLATTTITVLVVQNAAMAVTEFYPPTFIGNNAVHVTMTEHEVSPMEALQIADLGPFTVTNHRTDQRTVSIQTYALGTQASIEWRDGSPEGTALFLGHLRSVADGFVRAWLTLCTAYLLRISTTDRDLMNLSSSVSRMGGLEEVIRAAYTSVGIINTNPRGVQLLVASMNNTLASRGRDAAVTRLVAPPNLSMLLNYNPGVSDPNAAPQSVATAAWNNQRLSAVGVDKIVTLGLVQNGPQRPPTNPLGTLVISGRFNVLLTMQEVIALVSAGKYNSSVAGRALYNYRGAGSYHRFRVIDALWWSGLFGQNRGMPPPNLGAGAAAVGAAAGGAAATPIDQAYLVSMLANSGFRNGGLALSAPGAAAATAGAGGVAPAWTVAQLYGVMGIGNRVFQYINNGGSNAANQGTVRGVLAKVLNTLTWKDMEDLDNADCPLPFSAIVNRPDVALACNALLGVGPGPVGRSYLGEMKATGNDDTYGLSITRTTMRMGAENSAHANVTSAPGAIVTAYVSGGTLSARTGMDTQAARLMGSLALTDQGVNSGSAICCAIFLSEGEAVRGLEFITVDGLLPVISADSVGRVQFSSGPRTGLEHSYQPPTNQMSVSSLVGSISVAGRALASGADGFRGMGLNRVSCRGASMPLSAFCDGPELDASFGSLAPGSMQRLVNGGIDGAPSTTNSVQVY